jgi:hypothetical protein
LFAEVCERVLAEVALFRDVILKDEKLLRGPVSLLTTWKDDRLASVALFRLLIGALSPLTEDLAFLTTFL